jgi:hypothetical protein
LWGVNSFAAPNSAAGNSFHQAVQSEVTPAFARFIGGQNADDSSIVSEAVLITPLLFTEGDPGEQASTLPVRWGGVFVKTTVGWRISSIFITPFPRWHAK